MDGSSPGEQLVQNNALLRPGLEPETSLPAERPKNGSSAKSAFFLFLYLFLKKRHFRLLAPFWPHFGATSGDIWYLALITELVGITGYVFQKKTWVFTLLCLFFYT